MMAQYPCSPCYCSADNSSNASSSATSSQCAQEVPIAQYMFDELPLAGLITVCFLAAFTFTVLCIYFEEIYFILTQFRNHFRKTTTIWILAVYPVYACCSLLGACVPRAGPLVDMISSVYFGSCLYNFSRLMVAYLGGRDNALRIIKEGRYFNLNTPPCCCCCVCLPKVKFRKSIYTRMTILVMQVTIIRPLTMFIAAILWANGDFVTGTLAPYSYYSIITVVNTISTMLAVYGLMLFKRVYRTELERRYLISGKILSIQVILLVSDVPDIILSMLVLFGVIKCTALFPASTRANEIYHCLIVFMMLPFCVMGRFFFRRKSDGILNKFQDQQQLQFNGCSIMLPPLEEQQPQQQPPIPPLPAPTGLEELPGYEGTFIPLYPFDMRTTQQPEEDDTESDDDEDGDEFDDDETEPREFSAGIQSVV